MILQGDALEELRKLPDKCCSVCVTSPPYYNARDYGAADQLGTESSPEEYIRKLVEAFREVARVLKDDGTLWLNIGDSYARHIEDGGIKRKDLIGIRGCWLWLSEVTAGTSGRTLSGTNPTPCRKVPKTDQQDLTSMFFYSVKRPPITTTPRPSRSWPSGTIRKARPEARQRENLPRRHCLHSRSAKANSAEVDRGSHGLQRNETGKRNRRDVWTIATRPYKGAHLSTFPEELAKICILAGSKPGDTVLDPFSGSGTTGAAASKKGGTISG